MILVALVTSAVLQAIQAHRLPEAESMLRADLKSNPGDLDDIELLALVLDQQHKFTDAASLYRQAVARDSKNPGLLNNYANHLLSKGDKQGAERYYRDVLALDPNHPGVKVQLAGLALDFHRPKEAERLLQGAPDTPHVAYLRAEMLRLSGNNAAGLEAFVKADQAHPNDPEIMGGLARSLLENGAFHDSVSVWDRYLALAPGDDGARRERAFAEAAMSSESGLDELNTYTTSHPNDAVGWYELAVAVGPKDPGTARKDLDRALRLDPDLAPARMGRGILLYKAGDYAGAASDFEAVLEQQPENVRALVHLAQCKTASGMNTQALALLNRAERLAPDDTSVVLALGRAQLRAGETGAAQQSFRKARDLRPVNASQTDGVLLFLQMSPSQREAEYRAGVERTAQQQPNNLEAQIRYLELVPVSDSNKREEIASHIVSLSPDARTVADLASALLTSDPPDPKTAQILLGYGAEHFATDPNIQALTRTVHP